MIFTEKFNAVTSGEKKLGSLASCFQHRLEKNFKDTVWILVAVSI